MLFFRFWQNVANSLRRRFFDDLFAFHFMFFFVQITIFLKVETGERIIIIKISFAFIAWYINFIFIATLIFFFFICLLKHWKLNVLWIFLQNSHRHFNAFFWWKYFANRYFCAQCTQHCLFLHTYVQWSYFWHFMHCFIL